MNLLYSHGHPNAHNYPLGYVWDESEIVTERMNNMVATEAVLTQLAISSVLSKKAHKEFDKALKKLVGKNGFK